MKDKDYIPAILIGQIRKNFNKEVKHPDLEKGYLLNDALLHIKKINKVVPIRLIYLECYDSERLKDYYMSFGFQLYMDKNEEIIKKVYKNKKMDEKKEVIVMYMFIKDITNKTQY